MLMAFAGLLIIIFIIELAVGIAAAVYKSDFQEALKESLKKSMENYSDPNNPERISWDNVQRKLMCCGVDGPGDWQGQSTPNSCCTSEKLDQETEAYCLDNAFGTYMFKTGCFEHLKGKFESNSTILIGVGIGIAFVEVIGIVLACWLAYTIKNEDSGK
ncbi:unnamed protein product [Phaedon cochleariae]|uniref:Tetraspanin n=1 Tax=Phaedon cochleariae TaxID=80249 RepID=A0A9P0DGD1_PHACE|nr:unnamed protein product [Phaedon cochleariae]